MRRGSVKVVLIAVAVLVVLVGIGVVALGVMMFRGGMIKAQAKMKEFSTRPHNMTAHADATKGKYPPPQNEYRGRDAHSWGRDVLDIDERECAGSAAALKELGKEGIPYLLTAVQKQKKVDNIVVCLEAIDGKLIHPEDLAIIEPLQKHEHGQVAYNAERILKEAGKKP